MERSSKEELEMSRIVVTGGAGFIGSHLVDHLVSEGHEVKVIDDLSRGKLENLEKSKARIKFIKASLANPATAKKYIKDADVVYHLASLVGGVLKMSTQQAMSAIIPVVDKSVLDACVKNGVERVLYTSTACAYPVTLQSKEHENYLLKESDLLPANAESIYGWAKFFGEQVARRYHSEFGIKVAIVRDFNVYGTREDTNPETSHVIPALIKRAIEKQDPFDVWGSGEQSRSFVHAYDVTKAMAKAPFVIEDGTSVNLGWETRIKIKELANMVLRICELTTHFFPEQIKMRPDLPEGVFTRAPDTTLAKKLLDWSPKVTLDEGIKELANWYVSKTGS